MAPGSTSEKKNDCIVSEQARAREQSIFCALSSRRHRQAFAKICSAYSTSATPIHPGLALRSVSMNPAGVLWIRNAMMPPASSNFKNVLTSVFIMNCVFFLSFSFVESLFYGYISRI
ncbi:MAG: hypothetical protein BWY31_03283 [Lentisphaerae bacterium ADurb.Bin242]|nr:MAG: hypothetical protein BWY31_03283 [Lentisphaerae bacterium ADurb.Bin242]